MSRRNVLFVPKKIMLISFFSIELAIKLENKLES